MLKTIAGWLCLCLAAASWGAVQACRVTAISDGDTVKCLQDWRELTVRLGQIDAPEKAQPYGQRARAALAARVFGRNVQLERHETDKYGRIVGRLWLGGVDINLAQVQDGWAWAYRDYLKEPHYIAAENSARAAGRGLWAGSGPVRRQDWRRGSRRASSLPPLDTPVAPPAANPGHSTPASPARPAAAFQCGSKNRCSQMASCAEAQFYLQQCGVKKLDGNNDGIPCASLCRP